MQMLAVIHEAIDASGAWILISLIHVDLQMIAANQLQRGDEDTAEKQKVDQQCADPRQDERSD